MDHRFIGPGLPPLGCLLSVVVFVVLSTLFFEVLLPWLES